MTNIFELAELVLAGGTIMGLSKLLTNLDHFEDVIPLTKVGTRKKLDITVGDIYEWYSLPIDNSLALQQFWQSRYYRIKL